MSDTGSTPDSSPPGPDDINERLAEIAAELAGEAKFLEPRAADRGRRPVLPNRKARQHRRSGRTPRWGPLRRRRNARIAAKLREPVTPPGGSGTGPPDEHRRRKRDRKRDRSSRGSRASPESAPSTARDSDYATSSHPSTIRSLVAVVVVVGLLFGASVGLRTLFRAGNSGAPSPKRGANRASTPSAIPLFSTSNPFAGSPAEGYAEGSTGIVLPRAHAIGAFSAAQVARAYETTKQLLIAANLNWPTLHGGYPHAFARLLTPLQRRWFDSNLSKMGLTTTGQSRSSRIWVTSFAPGSTTFVGRVIKVSGLPVTARAAQDKGRTVLQVHADFLFVYAVQQPDAPSNMARIVAQTYDTFLFARWNDPGGPLEPWVADGRVADSGVQCESEDGYVHPQFVEPGAVPPPGHTVDPYKLNGSQPVGSACVATTGT